METTGLQLLNGTLTPVLVLEYISILKSLGQKSRRFKSFTFNISSITELYVARYIATYTNVTYKSLIEPPEFSQTSDYQHSRFNGGAQHIL